MEKEQERQSQEEQAEYTVQIIAKKRKVKLGKGKKLMIDGSDYPLYQCLLDN